MRVKEAPPVAETKKVLLLMPHMIGGGAERVGALLMNGFAKRGYGTEIALTADRAEDVVRCGLGEETALTLLPEILPAKTPLQKLFYGGLLRLFALPSPKTRRMPSMLPRTLSWRKWLSKQ